MEIGGVGKNNLDRWAGVYTGHETGVNLAYQGGNVQYGWSNLVGREVSDGK